MTPPISKILLKGGTLLIHDDKDHVLHKVSDLLVDGSTISKIATDINVSNETPIKVVDCRGKIISPGFIDTHQHLFASQVKAQPADRGLVGSFACYHIAISNYTEADAFWGELCGAMECVNNGTTTVVDHGHAALSEHSGTLIQALATSGLRSIFCHSPARQTDFSSPSALDDFRKLIAASPYANGRVSVGYAMDNVYIPGDVLRPYYSALRSLSLDIITTHGPGGVIFGKDRPSVIKLLDQHRLLGPDVLISHANNPGVDDSALLARSGAHVSSTVGTELHLGLTPLAADPDFAPHSSLGTDGHLWANTFMPQQMAALLRYTRHRRGQDLAKQGKWSKDVGLKAEEAFNLATIAGAKAVNMNDSIGRLREGFKADLLIFDGCSPSMLIAAQQDPLGAVVLHSSIDDLEIVIIDGIIRKENRTLVDVEPLQTTGLAQSSLSLAERYSWREIARETASSYQRLDHQMKDVDTDAAENLIIDWYAIDRQAMIN